MTPPRSPERGAADGAALVAGVILGALALLPSLLLRGGEGWRKCRDEALVLKSTPTEGAPAPRTRVLDAADAARASLARSPFRPDPSRRPGPALLAAETTPPITGPAGARIADLDGRVVEGRLSIRWTPAPGSRATALRIEGLGETGALDREIPSSESSLDLPVPGTSGTVVVRASPVGAGSPAPEARVSIPFRIAVEVIRVERAHGDTGSAILRLRRAYDGKVVEADFALHESDAVGDLSSVVEGGPVVDFRTDLVLEEVRDLRAPGPFVEVPQFGPEGKVLRDAEGRVLTYGRASTVDAGQEVVLRGPNDERRVVPVR